MKIASDKLPQQLKGVKPIYLVTGDEPLQMDESLAKIRQHVFDSGFDSRERFFVEAGFDWSDVKASYQSMSLFADKTLIEIRIPGGKLGKPGADLIAHYLKHADDDHTLLVSLGKVDASGQKSKWFKAIDANGLVVQIWPIPANRMEQWVDARMRKAGLQPKPDVARQLAIRTEGNLLATRQEIEKLVMLFGVGVITADQIDESVSESARFDVFELVDALLLGDVKRANRVLMLVQQEGIEAIIVLWAVHRELRQLCSMAKSMEMGEPLDRVLAKFRVWDKRKAVVKRGLSRFRFKQWQQLLLRCSTIDQTIKGLHPGDVWFQLSQLCLAMAKVNVFSSKV
ncbi:MAG: DNA polymerase III subunit delta [Methylococcales bacterium]|nr:DNA polymerase III subunit delta [Methylococcales bacterium]MBT7443474.1 DNA polymerase III subunit delta [Methylococcales bacterium]